jgi:hypothetical protein
MPPNIISGLSPGDTIDLAGAPFESGGTVQVKSSGSVLEVVEGANIYDLHLDPAGNYAIDQFRLTSDGIGGSDVTIDKGEQPTVTVNGGNSTTPIGVPQPRQGQGASAPNPRDAPLEHRTLILVGVCEQTEVASQRRARSPDRALFRNSSLPSPRQNRRYPRLRPEREMISPLVLHRAAYVRRLQLVRHSLRMCPGRWIWGLELRFAARRASSA